MIKSVKIFIVITVFFLGHFQSIGQTKLIATDDSEVSIDGTSTLHDWTSKSNSLVGEGSVKLDGILISKVESFQITIPVKSIESGKSKMDNYTYKALKADQFTNISFQMTSCIPQENTLDVTGLLSIAGKSREIRTDVEYQVQDDMIVFQCSESINMMDWDIEPPQLFMGTLKTGKDVIVSFKIRCKLEKQQTNK